MLSSYLLFGYSMSKLQTKVERERRKRIRAERKERKEAEDSWAESKQADKESRRSDSKR